MFAVGHESGLLEWWGTAKGPGDNDELQLVEHCALLCQTGVFKVAFSPREPTVLAFLERRVLHVIDPRAKPESVYEAARPHGHGVGEQEQSAGRDDVGEGDVGDAPAGTFVERSNVGDEASFVLWDLKDERWHQTVRGNRCALVQHVPYAWVVVGLLDPSWQRCEGNRNGLWERWREALCWCVDA